MLNFLKKTFNDPKNPEQMRKIHKIINKIDANKDARHANITVDGNGRPRFESAVDFMVGDKEFSYNTDRDLKDIEDFVVPPIEKLKSSSNDYAFANSLGDTPILVSMLKPNKNKNVRIISSAIPETYTCAFVDAAANPKEYQPNIVVYETPASFIDPGTRSQGEKLLPNVGTSIKIDLYDYGFAQDSFFQGTIRSDGRADLEIHFTGCVIKTIIDRNGNCSNLTINGSPGPRDLFSGNPTKNSFLNTKNDPLLAKAYVICKELGDTVQCIIILALKALYPDVINTSTSITFTPDIVFALRCRLLGVPCLLKKMVSNSMYRTLILYTGEVDPIHQREAINNGVINQSISNNNDIKQTLNTLIINGLFKLGSQDYSLSESGKNYIREIIATIDEANEALEELRRNNREEHSYIKYEACKLNAFNLFGKSTDRANMSIKTLFPKDSGINIGFGAGFGYKLKSENEKGIQYRGGVKQQYTGGELENYIIDDYYDLFYSYLYYIGANYVDDEFLYYLIQHPTLEEAESQFYETILPKLEYEDSSTITANYKDHDDSCEELTKLVKADISNFLKIYVFNEPYSSEPKPIHKNDIIYTYNHLNHGKIKKVKSNRKYTIFKGLIKNYHRIKGFTKYNRKRKSRIKDNRYLKEYYKDMEDMEDMEVSGGKIESTSSMPKSLKNKTRSKQNKTFRTTRRKWDN